MSKEDLVLIFFLSCVLIFGAALFWHAQNPGGQREYAPLPPHTSNAAGAQSLGATIYDKSQNPIQGQIPTANPLDGAYKNPFE